MCAGNVDDGVEQTPQVSAPDADATDAANPDRQKQRQAARASSKKRGGRRQSNAPGRRGNRAAVSERSDEKTASDAPCVLSGTAASGRQVSASHADTAIIADDAGSPEQPAGPTPAHAWTDLNWAGREAAPLAEACTAADSDDDYGWHPARRRVEIAMASESVITDASVRAGVLSSAGPHLALVHAVHVLPEATHLDISTCDDDAVSEGGPEDGCGDNGGDAAAAAVTDAVQAAAAEVCNAMLAPGRKAARAAPRPSKADRSSGGGESPRLAQPQLSAAGNAPPRPRGSDSYGGGSTDGGEVRELEALLQGRGGRPPRQCCAVGLFADWADEAEEEEEWSRSGAAPGRGGRGGQGSVKKGGSAGMRPSVCSTRMCWSVVAGLVCPMQCLWPARPQCTARPQ